MLLRNHPGSEIVAEIVVRTCTYNRSSAKLKVGNIV